MVYLMVESMEYWQDSLSKFGGGFPAMMDYVLEQQEKAGMLPPYEGSFPEDVWQSGDFEWEPESE